MLEILVTMAQRDQVVLVVQQVPPVMLVIKGHLVMPEILVTMVPLGQVVLVV
jgi:hypothetical protein